MNPKTKKVLFIVGLSLDLLVTVFLFVFSIIILANIPEDVIDEDSFLGWFQVEPMRILLLVVLPLLLLLALNVFITFVFFKKSEKKKVTLNDLSEEEKEVLRKKILQEMLENDSKK